VDSLGLLLVVAVHSAGIQDTNGAYFVLRKMMNLFPRLSLIWVDGGYQKGIIDWAKNIFGWVMQVVKRSDDIKGFKLLPRRWVVERTFAWIANSRRTSKDYEHSTLASEAMVYIPMIRIMLKKLTKG
jgi:putative transposase